MLRLRFRASFAIALLATAMSMTWAGTSVLARFTDSAPVGANTFSTAASFCAGSTTSLTPTADTYLDEDSGDPFGGSTSLYVRSWNDRPSNQRILVNFALPTVPAGCSVTSVTLAFTTISGVAGRTLEATRVTQSWTEGVGWYSQPTVTTPVATASTTATADALVSFDVTSQVQAMYPSSAFGLRIKDSVENSSTSRTQSYYSRESTSTTKRPKLTVVIG